MMNFIKEIQEARLVRNEQDQRQSYTEVCENLYLLLLTIEFLNRISDGKQLAESYARSTAGYTLYQEFRTSATDLYNMIYFVQASPEKVEEIFDSADAKKLREKTHLPILQLNRWLLKTESEDMYFFMRLENAMSITDTDCKEIRRLLSYKNPSETDLRSIASRILNALRFKIPLLDIRQDIENILNKKLTYVR